MSDFLYWWLLPGLVGSARITYVASTAYCEDGLLYLTPDRKEPVTLGFVVFGLVLFTTLGPFSFVLALLLSIPERWMGIKVAQ